MGGVGAVGGSDDGWVVVILYLVLFILLTSSYPD